MTSSYGPVQPHDEVRGPIRNKAKADAWRAQGLKVQSRVDRGGHTSYARVGVYPNKTERHGLLRRKRTSPDLEHVQYQLAKSAFGVVHEVAKKSSGPREWKDSDFHMARNAREATLDPEYRRAAGGTQTARELHYRFKSRGLMNLRRLAKAPKRLP